MATLLFDVICWQDGDLGLIARGAVDARTVASFESVVARAISTAPVNLLIDVTQCELASAGLGALRDVRFSPETTVVLVASSPAVSRLLQIAGLASRYRIYATLEIARDACHDAEPESSSRRVERHEWRRSDDLATRERAFAFAPSGSPARQDGAGSAIQGADGGPV
jgi:anti-anti-sigma factor